MYDRTQLHQFIDDLRQTCNAALDEIGGDTIQTQTLRNALLGQLEAIKQIHLDEDNSEGNIVTPNLAIRDHIAAAANIAYQLAGDPRRLNAKQHPDANARLFYACLASTLVQLKRVALSAAAAPLARNWAARELTRLERSVPTINFMPRSMLSDDASLGASHHFGPVGLSIGASRSRIFWFDDDRDANFWNAFGGSVSLDGPEKWIADLKATLNIEAGSVYFETDSMEEVLRLVLNLDANHPANRLLQQSAAPGMRKFMIGLRRSRYAFERTFLGRIHTSETDKPDFLSDAKIGKGADPTQLRLHARALDQLMAARQNSNVEAKERRSFSELFSRAFPSPSERARRSESFPDPFSAAIPDSDPLGHGKAPYRNYRVAASAGIGKFNEIEAGVSPGAGGSATLSANIAQFHLQNVEPSNRLLDPDYHADMTLTFKLVNSIDAQRSEDPRMHLYRGVKERFGTQAVETQVLAQIDQHYYGPPEAIPDCLRTAIAGHQTVNEIDQRIIDIGQYCGELHESYLAFMEHAAHIKTTPDRFTHGEVQLTLQTLRREAFDAINRDIWGANDDRAGYPGGMNAALKRPDAFIAASHDAIGLALGLAGIYLAIFKRRMTQVASTLEPSEQAPYAGNIQAADAAYITTKTALNQPGVPMKREHLFLRENTFEDRGTSQRYNLITQLSGNGGASLNMFDSIAHQRGASMEGYSINNAAGTIAATVRVRLQHADLQINPSRQGQFIEFKFTFNAGAPIANQVLVETLLAGLERVYFNSVNDDERRRQRTSIAEQLQGTVWPIAAGAGVTVRLRKFPNARPLDFRLQFVQLHEERTGGHSVGIPLPNPAGVTTLGLNRQHTLQNVVREYMGADISYLMLQHKKLERVMKHSASFAIQHGVTENDVLKAIFTGRNNAHTNTNPNAGIPWQHAISHNYGGIWVAESYFGIGTMIPTVIDDYIAYRATEEPREDNENGSAEARFTTEFSRYYKSHSEQEPFRRVAEIAREVKHHAPGSTAQARSESGGFADPFTVPPSLLTPIAAPELPQGRTWEAEKAHIASLQTLEDRIDYYCSERGRPVLDWFIRIVENTRTIHNLSRHRASKTAYGFQTRLKGSGSGDTPAGIAKPAKLVKQRKPQPGEAGPSVASASHGIQSS